MTLVGERTDDSLPAAAFSRVSAELCALDNSEVLQVNLEVTHAVAMVLAALPELRSLRARIVKELPTFDTTQLDQLKDYALALSHAQQKYEAVVQLPEELIQLHQRAGRFRDRLLAEARSLTHHGLVSQAEIGQLRGAHGYISVATDVLVLVNLLQHQWSEIEGKCFTTAIELERASRVATRILRIVEGPAELAEVTETRRRAFTLFMRGYEETRRAVVYVCAKQPGSADTIAPPLHPIGRRSDSSLPPTNPMAVVAPLVAPLGVLER